MKTEQRRKELLDHLIEVGADTVEDMATRFDVSRMTIHRDLDQLEKDGFLRKVRGGASVQSNTQFESDFLYRKRLEAAEKRRIAAAAVAKIEKGKIIIIDDGSTAAAMAQYLPEKRPLTVITNNSEVIQELQKVNGITLIALGGVYNRRFHGFFGLVTEQGLHTLRADIAFLSTSSVSGITAFHQDQEVVKTKRAMILAADRSYLLVDHTKFDRTALNLFTDLTDFAAVITGQKPVDNVSAELFKAGVHLEVSPGGDD